MDDAVCSSFEGHPLQVKHKQDWGRGFILLLPQIAALPDQMLVVVLLSQHRVSSSKTVRPRAPCGDRCTWQAVSTWSAVCSEALHSQSVKERDPICAWTNGIAQHQSEGG